MGFIRRTVLGLPEHRADTDGGTDSPAPIPPARPTGRPVTIDSALSLSGVYRAISILATTISQLQISTWRQGRPVPAPDIVRKPDPARTQRSFLRRTVTGLAANGNAYWRIFRDTADRPSALRVLNPLAVAIRYDSAGRRWFDYSGDQRLGRPTRPVTLPDSDVIHMKLLEVPGHDYGLGPIQAARVGLAGALDLDHYATKLFHDGDIPTGVLTSDQALTPGQADDYRDRWHETQQERQIAVLGRGLTYEPIILKPADAQYLQSRQFTVSEIARLFGLPASYLLAEVNGSAITYQNLEQVDQQYMKFTAMGYINLIEDAFSEVTPNGQTQQFRVWDFLRADNYQRAQIQEIYLKNKVMTVAEVREMEGLGPVSAGQAATRESEPIND